MGVYGPSCRSHWVTVICSTNAAAQSQQLNHRTVTIRAKPANRCVLDFICAGAVTCHLNPSSCVSRGALDPQRSSAQRRPERLSRCQQIVNSGLKWFNLRCVQVGSAGLQWNSKELGKNGICLLQASGCRALGLSCISSLFSFKIVDPASSNW